MFYFLQKNVPRTWNLIKAKSRCDIFKNTKQLSVMILKSVLYCTFPVNVNISKENVDWFNIANLLVLS